MAKSIWGRTILQIHADNNYCAQQSVLKCVWCHQANYLKLDLCSEMFNLGKSFIDLLEMSVFN